MRNYVRHMIRPVSDFQKKSFRVIDPGKPGHLKLIVGRPKGMKKTRVQAMLLEKKDFRKGMSWWK